MIYFAYKYVIWLDLNGNGLSAPCSISGMAQKGLKDVLLRWVTHMSVKWGGGCQL